MLVSGPRLARIWLISDLARNRFLDSENQDTIDNNLWWRYLYFEWLQLSGGWNSIVPSLCKSFTLPASHSLHQWTSLQGSSPPHVWIQFLFILAKFSVYFILSPTPFLLHFSLVFFSIWLLNLSFNFTEFSAYKVRLEPKTFIYLQSG